VTGEISETVLEEGDEAVFVIPSKSAARMRESALTSALMKLLGKKVWITAESDEWKDRTRRL
jgi:hypothetical protein